ncbi:MAG: hypothetical protein FJZ38_15010 [Candidatus Rokubacteria bacterium]|nr:hypothetical protein [Candidatus Rokubacteria bacterium]
MTYLRATAPVTSGVPCRLLGLHALRVRVGRREVAGLQRPRRREHLERADVALHLPVERDRERAHALEMALVDGGVLLSPEDDGHDRREREHGQHRAEHEDDEVRPQLHRGQFSNGPVARARLSTGTPAARAAGRSMSGKM